MVKKVQVPVIGGIRKVIQAGAVASGTTISEFGANTVTLAQLAQALSGFLGVIGSSGSNLIGGGNEATITVGPGLSGGGPVLGNVPIRLTAPIGYASYGDAEVEVEPAIPGPRGYTGSQGAPGQTVWMQGEDGEDGQRGATGVQGVQGIQGPIGPSGSGGGSWGAYLDFDQGEDVPVGILNLPSVPAFAGAILGGVNNALPIVAPANGSQSLTASGLTFSFGSLLLTNTAEISSVGQVGIGSSTGAGGLILFTAASQRVTISPTGAVVVNAPSAGTALQVTGLAGSDALVVQGAATTGSAFGALLAGGSNASDYGLTVNNQANTLNYFSVRGDGNVIAGGFGTNADSQFRVYSGGSTSKCDFRVGFNGTTSNFLDGGTFNIRDPGATFSIGAFSATGTGLTLASAASQTTLQVNGHLSVPAAIFTNGTANDTFIELQSASGSVLGYVQAASSIPDVRFGSLSNHSVSIVCNSAVFAHFNPATSLATITGGIQATYLSATTAAPSTPTGISYGGTTATTASTTVGGVALPALLKGFIVANIGGTQVKIPYCAN